MNKVYYLSICETCRRLLKETDAGSHFKLQDIKNDPVSAEELDQLAAVAGSYEALFSRRALKYRAMGLQEKELSETDYRSLLLSEYTFLKRPVFWLDGKVFAGSAAKNLKALGLALKLQ